MGEEDAIGVDADLGRDALEDEDNVDNVVVHVEELGLLLLLCSHLHPLEGIHRLHRLLAHHLKR